MRYQDILDEFAGFDPLQENVTAESPHIKGVYAPESKIYIKINAGNRVSVTTSDAGYFEYEVSELRTGDIISLQVKIGSKFEEFWNETVRE